MESTTTATQVRGPRRVQAVDHAVDVLDCLARAGGSIGVSDVARQTGLSKATVHHLLATLEARRLIIRESHAAAYRLGWALYEWGEQVAQGSDVARVARPFLDELARSTGESVLLGILDRDSVLYLDRGDGRSGFRMVATAGMRSPLHSNASGKVLLAAAADDFVDRYLTTTLETFTPFTITDPAQVRTQIERVRAAGHATCWQERELGLCSLAMPIVDHTGGAVAALTIAGPAGRVTPEGVDDYLAHLTKAAAEIGVQLGAPANVPALPPTTA